MSNISNLPPIQHSMPQQNAQNRQLTSEQQQLITDTLAQFDPDSMTETDALSIVEAFSEAGIQPSRALAETVAQSGFDARSIGELAGGQGANQGNRPPPPPPGQGTKPSLNLSDELLSELNEMLNNYYSNDLSDEDKASTLESIQQILQASAPQGGLINVKT
ncbi:MAG: hypothetical protein OFPI_33400 [Osedax symbiont Rs2]|nr:MAG: hypothetical protein OFPI_33400 [Osedax symbiont Rs2]